ncbi:MAG: valine--tRNA ligase [Flavobacteriaceae bacterium]|nr:valine--tRNA ligase [Flavobacteriaceae bacterium]
MSIPSKFTPKVVERKWYDYWTANNYFHSTPDSREPYTIVIPPPNVTGVLHMGHLMNNTLQDVLIRRARMRGYNACWVPGTDHASIATEAKVVNKLKSQGIDKNEIGREAFLEHAWEWTHEHGGIILEQLKKLGCTCDWDRTKFTLDPEMSASVIKVFVDLYNKGMIYRGFRMVHWDPEAQTTLSDEEVIYEERQGNLYHIAYAIENSDEKVVVATTRPETLFGDTAVAIHPEDERYLALHGKKAIVPIVNRVVPIIKDTYVSLDLGTGCLKVTPAHDENDKVLGEKHKLEIVDIFNADATLNHQGLHYEGKDRFAVRKAVVKELEAAGALVKVTPHMHKVGTSERTKAVIEPRLSDQWFLKMADLAKPAIDAVEDGDVQLVPKKFINTYRHWMQNIRDWNISRQLWWGHQIPAYYYGSNREHVVVAESKSAALEKAKTDSGNTALTLADLHQDPDVLDTWFSSWLWPISVFNGVLEPDNKEVSYYYPTQELVTGPDILFFWVARMIMSGYALRNEKPFSHVYLTGLVRDGQGRKMSKQLGNSPDAIKLMETYGADGVRVGLLLSAAAGNDLLFDENLCQQGKNFANKIWNAFRLIQSWEVDETLKPCTTATAGIDWYSAKFHQTLATIDDHFSKYRISDALMSTYKLVWDDFCSWFLEIVKPAYNTGIDRETYEKVCVLFEDNLRLLHPFMPFLSEELWHALKRRTKAEALIVSDWPKQKNIDTAILKQFEHTASLIAQLRTVRKEQNISFKEPLDLIETNQDNISLRPIVEKLVNVQTWSKVAQAPDQAISFRVNAHEYFVPVSASNIEEERKKMEEELAYQQGFLRSVEKKLSNERFVSNAPEQVVATERKKAADAQTKITALKARLSAL